MSDKHLNTENQSQAPVFNWGQQLMLEICELQIRINMGLPQTY